MRFASAFIALSALAGTSYGQQAIPATLSPQPLPREVMYRILFREVAAYQAEADRLAALSKPNAFVRDYHQTLFQLSPANAARLKQVALPCAQQIQALDQQAETILKAVKSKYKGVPRGSPDAMVPPPPQELMDLEAQRTAVVLAAANSLTTAFGPGQFVYFESLVRRHVGAGFKASASAVKTQ